MDTRTLFFFRQSNAFLTSPTQLRKIIGEKMADVAFAISVLVAAVTVLRNHAVIFVDKTCVQSCYLYPTI